MYLGRAGLSPVVYEGFLANGVAAGGMLTKTTLIENFPGVEAVEGVQGPVLMERMSAQASHFGARALPVTVSRVDLSARPFAVFAEGSDGVPHALCDALIVATGAAPRTLDVPGAAAYWQKGLSTCATCDGALPVFRNKPIAVVGGGDTACEEALHLTRFASRVYLVHRRDSLRASKAMAQRALAHPKITPVWNAEVAELRGDGRMLQSLLLRDVGTGALTELPAAGLFLAIGHLPASGFLRGQLACDAEGYIQTGRDQATSVEGVWAAGDVQDRHWRQAITAAGSGCVAALECERWLSAKGSA